MSDPSSSPATSRHTLQVSAPFGRTLALTGVAVAVIWGLAEGAASTPDFGKPFRYPISRGDVDLGVKIGLADQEAQTHGPLDCAVVGSSLALAGVDPQAMADSYFSHTGQTLRCFNFGLNALNDSGAADMAQIASQRYRPRLILFATSFRDYQDVTGRAVTDPWGRSQLGEHSVEGWLVGLSASYRGMNALADTLFGESRIPTAEERFRPLGYFRQAVTDQAAEPNEAADARLNRALAEFDPRAVIQREGWQRLMTLPESGATVIVVEMPVPPSSRAFLPNGEADYQAFVAQIAASAAEHEILFWPTPLETVPANGWRDHYHLNDAGAQVFSAWLGEQLADAINSGQIPRFDGGN